MAGVKDEALNAAATAVRAELLRLDYIEGWTEPDGEDKAIAAAAIRAWLTVQTKQILTPKEYSDIL